METPVTLVPPLNPPLDILVLRMCFENETKLLWNLLHLRVILRVKKNLVVGFILRLKFVGWESPGDLPLVIEIIVSFRSFRCAPLTKRHKISITRGRSPGLSQERIALKSNPTCKKKFSRRIYLTIKICRKIIFVKRTWE
jgi:hypothetical protein